LKIKKQSQEYYIIYITYTQHKYLKKNLFFQEVFNDLVSNSGEKVAGFSSLRNGRFREVMLITSDADMDEFCRRYAVDRDRIREITAG
jgi:hypothetical protein